MQKTIPTDCEGARFVGLYGVGEDYAELIQKLTPARDSIAAVMADLSRRQKHEGGLGFAQILDLSVLEPVEPYQVTLARLNLATSRENQILPRL